MWFCWIGTTHTQLIKMVSRWLLITKRTEAFLQYTSRGKRAGLLPQYPPSNSDRCR